MKSVSHYKYKLELTFYCFSLCTVCFIAFRVIFLPKEELNVEYLLCEEHTFCQVSVFNALRWLSADITEIPPHKSGALLLIDTKDLDSCDIWNYLNPV